MARVELASGAPVRPWSVASPPADAIVADLLDGTGRPLAATLALQQRDTHRVPVIALVQPRPRELRAVGEAARAGADIAMPGHESLADALRAILGDRSHPRRQLRQRVLSLAHSAAAGALLEQCLLAPPHVTTSKSLSVALGCTTRTLSRRFAASGLPPAGHLMRWLRVVGAISSLASGTTARAAARANGYASVAALRHALRAVAGLDIPSARSPLALAGALESLATVLEHAPARATRDDRESATNLRTRSGHPVGASTVESRAAAEEWAPISPRPRLPG